MNLSFDYNGKRYTNFTAEDALAMKVPENVIAIAEKEAAKAFALSSRKLAYTFESDPLYIEWQFDQDPEIEKLWREKVAEIKKRFPLED